MIKTLKNFGILCAVESGVAVTFLVTAGLCMSAGAIDGVVVSLLISGGAVGLGLLRYRKLTALCNTRQRQPPLICQNATAQSLRRRNPAR